MAAFLGGGDEFEIVLERRDRRQEDAEVAVAHLDGDRGADLAFDLGDHLLGAILLVAGIGGEGGGRLRVMADAISSCAAVPRRRGRSLDGGQRIARHDMRIGGGRHDASASSSGRR